MQNLLYGQPVGGITQVSYIVQDIEQSMLDYSNHLGTGPWFVSKVIEVKDVDYRGGRTTFRIRVAIGYSGHTQFELIQPVDEQPSVFQELVQRSGYGFHHWGVGTRTLEADIERLTRGGGQVVFQGRSQRGARVVYVEGVGDLPGLIELIDMTPEQEAFYNALYKAALGWDGTDPIRDVATML